MSIMQRSRHPSLSLFYKEITLMNKRLAALPLVASTLALSLAAAPAFAGKHIKPEKMTCEEFLMLDE